MSPHLLPTGEVSLNTKAQMKKENPEPSKKRNKAAKEDKVDPQHGHDGQFQLMWSERTINMAKVRNFNDGELQARRLHKD